MTENRRAYERFDSSMAIWIRAVDPEGDFILVESANISAGGLMLLMEDPISEGERFELRIELPQNNDLVEANGLVRRVIPEGPDHFGVGVEFTEVRNYEIPVLMAYIEAAFQ